MNQEKSFLDALDKEFTEMVQEGVITEEQLQNGIKINIDWLYSQGLNRKDIMKVMTKTLMQKNPSYEEQTIYKKREPKTLTYFIIKKDARTGEIRLDIEGKDDFTKFSIGKEHKEKPILQISEEEFINKLLYNIENRDMATQRSNLQEDVADAIRKFSQYIDSDYVRKALDGRMDILEQFLEDRDIDFRYGAKKREQVRTETRESLQDMSKNLGQYYRYLCEEKTKQDNGETEENDKTAPRVINGGIIDREHGTEIRRSSSRPNIGGRQRVSDIYEFDDRRKIFEEDVSNKPERIIKYDSIDENGDTIPNTHRTYIYNSPMGEEGYLIISEPLSGDQETRAIYLKSLPFIEEEIEDDESWKKLANLYLNESGEEFKSEKYTYTFRHTSLERYSKVMKAIIDGEPENADSQFKSRFRRIKTILFEGEKTVSQAKLNRIVESIIENGGISERTMAELREKFPELSDEQEEQGEKELQEEQAEQE